jgi:hypothetical protein
MLLNPDVSHLQVCKSQNFWNQKIHIFWFENDGVAKLICSEGLLLICAIAVDERKIKFVHYAAV